MISVIIPTYNGKYVLEDCIESLGFQTYPHFEVIVVDDGSSDNTGDVVRNLKSHREAGYSISNLKFLVQNHKGAGAARNRGTKYAKGKILVFVDADMTFDKDFLEKLVEPIEKGEAKGTFSKEEYVSNWDNVWARCWNVNEGWEPKRRHSKNYPDHQPVFRAILKNEFDRVGGFIPGGYDDDWSLSKKLGYEAVSAGGATLYHKNPGDLIEVFNHAKWVGKRKYKFGAIGALFALLRSSLPVSIAVGLYKSFRTSLPAFILFKIIYDFGIFIGILEALLLNKQFK